MIIWLYNGEKIKEFPDIFLQEMCLFQYYFLPHTQAKVGHYRQDGKYGWQVNSTKIALNMVSNL